MTKFSFEVPIQHLEDFEEYMDYTFALSFLLKDIQYASYINRKVKEGGLVMLDNSYNEIQKAETPSHMANLCKLFNPTFVMAPDADDFQVEDVVDNAIRVKELVGEDKTMAIYKNFEEREVLENAGIKHLAVSYYWRPFFPKEYSHPGAHFLGINSVDELIRHKPATVDSSMPLKMALAGYTLRDWIGSGCPHWHTKQDPMFFQNNLTKEVIDLTIQNIIALKEAVNGQG